MRQLGYPPGWLKEAEMEHSGLALYDGKGKECGAGNAVFSMQAIYCLYPILETIKYLICKPSYSSWKSEKVVNQVFFSKVT